MRFLRYVLPFAAVTALHMLFRFALEAMTALDQNWATIIAGLATFALVVLGVVVLRQRQGRDSLDAHTLFSASFIALVMAGFGVDRALTGGTSFFYTVLIVLLPTLAISLAVERLLYSPDERKRMRERTREQFTGPKA